MPPESQASGSASPPYPAWQPPPGADDPAYRDVLRRLYALGQGRMLPGRDRLRRVLARAGDPHLAVPSILVGGTNGKGSCVAALSAALVQAGQRAGAFLKPHLVSVRERWRIDDETVGVQQFTEVATEALDLIDAHRQTTDEEISFFEANVLIGALLFRDAKCDWAVWEVGLGGKEDACNLVDPHLSILCNVGLDHQHILGHKLAEIARDKAYIARPGRTLLLGGPRPGWEDAYFEYAPVVGEVCVELGAQVLALPSLPQSAWDNYIPGGNAVPPDIELLASSALALLGFKCPARLTMSYRGRMQLNTLGGLELSAMAGAEHLPPVPAAPALLDAAHNVDSIQWLARTLALGPRPLPLLFGCQATRDPLEMLAPLAPYISVLVPLEVPVLHPCPLQRIVEAGQSLGLTVSLPPAVAAHAAGGQPAADYAIGNVTELDTPDNSTGWMDCVAYALSLATDEQPLVICGSIYNLGEILRVFGPQPQP